MPKNLKKIKEEYNDLQKKLSNSELSFTLNREKYGELSKRFIFLQKIMEKVERKEAIEKTIKENEEILEKENEEELKELAKEENEILKKEKNNFFY